MSIDPGQVLDTKDPGDDVALRYRYQHCYAAINAVKLVVDEDDISEVICENHEDFIVKKATGLYVAVQVKTRDLKGNQFKSGDAALKKALEKFCKLNGSFEGSFECFEFVTNHSFWDGEESAQSFPWVLSKLKERKTVKGLKGTNPVRKFVDELCESAELEADIVVDTLLKTKISSRMNTLESIGADVHSALAECPGVDQLSYTAVLRIAKALIALVCDASTKAKDGPTTELYAAGSDFDAVVAGQLLANKKIRKSDVLQIIDEFRQQPLSFEGLDISDVVLPDEIPSDLARMIRKMARGGVQHLRVTEVQDLVRSFEALFLKWVNKYGAEEAQSRYNTLLVAVRHECNEARISAESSGSDVFGPEMYAELFERLRHRSASEPEQFFNCRPETLLGVTGLLTEQCKVWWSQEFDVSEGAT